MRSKGELRIWLTCGSIDGEIHGKQISNARYYSSLFIMYFLYVCTGSIRRWRGRYVAFISASIIQMGIDVTMIRCFVFHIMFYFNYRIVFGLFNAYPMLYAYMFSIYCVIWWRAEGRWSFYMGLVSLLYYILFALYLSKLFHCCALMYCCTVNRYWYLSDILTLLILKCRWCFMFTVHNL